MKLNQLFFRGIFVFLMLGCFSAFAQNDLCADAIEIQCGGISVNGSTTGATFDDVGFCDTSNTGPGVWYKFVGEGSEIVLSTCNQAAFDTKISIFSGECGALICVEGQDDAAGCAGFTTETDPVITEVGTTYYVLVHGFGTATGDFTLTLSCEAPDPPENDICPTAIALECGQTVTGSTAYATDTGAPGECETTVTAPGVWYTVEGTGGAIELSTCGSFYDTKLSVYEGACGNFDCVAGNDDDFSTINGGLDTCSPPEEQNIFSSSLSFDSVVGTTYYVYVHGFSTATGDFTLSVNCLCFVDITSGDCQTVYLGAGEYASDTATLTASGFGVGEFSYVWSDGQEGAAISVMPTETTVYTVTLTDSEGCFSTAETTVVVVDADCDNNGNADKVVICHRGETICVSINAVPAHLNHGDFIGACDQLNCETRPGCSSVTDPADFAVVTDPEQDVSWSVAPGYVAGYILSVGTSSGGTDVLNNQDVGNVNTYDLGTLDHDTTYYVTVSPYNDNGSALSCPESSFSTDFTPANDLCADTVSIACGDTVTGDTRFATADDAPGYDCEDNFWNNYNGQGVWYNMLGTGDDVVLSLCQSGYDTKISVYTGECGALACYAGNDDADCIGGAGIFRSEVEMTTEDGTMYYIYVSGFTGFGAETDPSAETGLFELSVTCTEPPVVEQGSDECADAVAIACGDTVSGTTVGYTDSGVDCSFNLGAAGVWYKFDGTGDTVTVNTCGAGTNYDTKIDVFSGDCGALACVGGNDDTCGLQSEVTFATSAGTSYYIYVNGFAGDGNYELSVECAATAQAANPNRGIESLSWGLTPNPSKGDVELDLSHFVNSNVTVDVIGFTGKLLATYKLEDLQNPKFNLQLNSSLTNGMYLVRVSSDEQVSSKRLILNR